MEPDQLASEGLVVVQNDQLVNHTLVKQDLVKDSPESDLVLS